MMPIIYADTVTYYDKDIEIDNITMYVLNFPSKQSVNHHFQRELGKWHLLKIDTNSMNELADNRFLDFLEKFSSDSTFQLEHTKLPVNDFNIDYSSGDITKEMKNKSKKY